MFQSALSPTNLTRTNSSGAGKPTRQGSRPRQRPLPLLESLSAILDFEEGGPSYRGDRDSDLAATITHWLHHPEADPIGLSASRASFWYKVLRSHFEGPPLAGGVVDRSLLIDFHGDVPFPPPREPAFRFVDLFAGIGGFRLALQAVGGRCVFSSEWDRSAKETYFANFGEVPFGDIRTFTGDNVSNATLRRLIPDHDLLAAGFPCQPFSRAGVSARTALNRAHGLSCEAQGTLFFDLMRIASVKRPRILLLENVKNLRSHDGGRTFAIVRRMVEEAGYTFTAEVVDSSALVPQRRERCFMVCIREDIGRFQFDLTPFHGPPLPLRSILEKNPNPEFTISDRLWRGHKLRTTRNLARGTGFTAHTADIDRPAHTLVARYGKDGKECLVPQTGKNPRMLTPRECARLQGFPEDFVVAPSRTNAYRQFGNSVAVPVVTEIAKQLIPFLRK